MNSSWNQMVDYGTLSNAPWGLIGPGAAGAFPELGALEPGRMYEVLDPRAIYFPRFNMDPNFYFGQNQQIQTWAEKMVNISDMQLGRAPTTPNAPRTARGQLAMIQMGNIAFSVLTAVHSQSFIEQFKRVHAFKKRWAKPEEVFRVLNKQSGLFEKRVITDKAFQADVDFEFQMMPNKSQEQQMNQALFGMTLSAVQQAIASPMIAPMVRTLLGDVYRSLGKKNFDTLWPENLVPNIMAQASMDRAAPPAAQGSGGPNPSGGNPPVPPEPTPPQPGGQQLPQFQQMGGPR
jgi:hypothetical protein